MINKLTQTKMGNDGKTEFSSNVMGAINETMKALRMESKLNIFEKLFLNNLKKME